MRLSSVLWFLIGFIGPIGSLEEYILENVSNSNYDDVYYAIALEQTRNYKPALSSTKTRFARSLDGAWDFCLDPQPIGFKSKFFNSALGSVCNPGDLYSMPVPSAFNDITSNKTVRNYMGYMWYQRQVEQAIALPPHLPKLILHLESVNYLAMVFVKELAGNRSVEDGRLVGAHVGGHLPFSVDLGLTSGPFLLTIVISNMLTDRTIPSGKLVDLSRQTGRANISRFEADFDFFHFAGILGSLELVSLPVQHIAYVNFEQTSARESGEFKFKVCLEGLGSEPRQVKFGIKLSQVHGSSESKQLLAGNFMYQMSGSQACSQFVFKQADFSHDLESWSLAKGRLRHMAALVQVSIELYDESSDHVTDRVILRTGVRPNLGLGPEEEWWKPLQGFGMHHEQLFSGRTMSQSAIMKDIYLLKKMGTTLIRTSHYPYSASYLDACDQHGLLVVGEMAAVGLRSFERDKLMLHKQLLREMLHRDHHHPSILMWSIANEPQSQLEPAKGYFESLTKYARSALAKFTSDSGRPLTAAIAQSHRDDLVGHTLDIIMVNRYYAWYDYTGTLEAIELPLRESLLGWQAKYPGASLILSEFGADSLEGFHSLSDELFSEEFQRDLLVETERVIDEFSYNETIDRAGGSGGGSWPPAGRLLGSMVWNFADFSTHNSLLRPRGNRKGVLTFDRRPKLSAHVISRLYLSRLVGAPSGGVVGRSRGAWRDACAASGPAALV